MEISHEKFYIKKRIGGGISMLNKLLVPILIGGFMLSGCGVKKMIQNHIMNTCHTLKI